MSLQLPHRPSIEHLRRQAKDLQRQLHAQGNRLGLQQAQQRLAQLYGFRSWLDLTRLAQRVREVEKHARQFAYIPKHEFENARNHISIAVLCEGVKHPNPDVRALCVGLMDHFGTNECVQALHTALKDPVRRVRQAALHSLGCQKCKASPLCTDIVSLTVESLLKDPDVKKVRRNAAYGLSNLVGDRRAVSALMASLNDPISAQNEEIRLFAIDGFTRALRSKFEHEGMDLIEPLVHAALNDSNGRIRGRAIDGLAAAMPEARAAAALKQLSDPKEKSASSHHARRVLAAYGEDIDRRYRHVIFQRSRRRRYRHVIFQRLCKLLTRVNLGVDGAPSPAPYFTISRRRPDPMSIYAGFC
jgi:HEAT repeat protein